MARRGAFILMEGVDRAGKSSQAAALVKALNKAGHRAELRRFPDRTTAIGGMINDYLRNATELDDRAIHLLFAANRWEAAGSLRKALTSGTTLVVDRYSYSGVAFSAAKEGMDIEWCKRPEDGLPAPDVVVFLDLTVEQAAARGGFGEERYETREFQGRVRENFRKLADELWVSVDAARSMEEVGKDILAVATKTVEEAGSKPIASLWPSGKAETGTAAGGAGAADAAE